MSQIHRKRLPLVLAACVLAAAPARAADDAMMRLLGVLRDKGTLDEATYESLVNAAKADAEHPGAAREDIGRNEKKTPRIDTENKFEITSADGDFQWRFIGLLMADYYIPDSDMTRIDTEGEIRRARLGMRGRLWQHWIWKLEYDFAGGDASLKDGYLGYEEEYAGGEWSVKVGQHHVPFGLATMSSSKYMLFLERPLMSDVVLQPSRQLGSSFFVNGGNDGQLWTFQTGIYGAEEVGDPDTFDELSIAARGTVNPYIEDKSHLVHLGGAVWYKDPNDTEVRVRQRPGVIRASDSRFIDADFGTGNVEDILAFNAEAVAVWGPAHLQAEYTNWNVSPNGAAFGGDDVTLDGYYVEASYFLTGESMRFETDEGHFSGMKPKGIVGRGGIGAWQLAARYDVMDLNDFEDGGVKGGREEDFRVALNWYPTNTIRFMADYVTVLDLDRPGSGFDGDEPSSVNLRAMVYW
ncbi:MAG: hypothetical protein NFCOHLIN_01726 [Gammaproteobacteria bacterium]|nr:hypothetical protein [Gammaproteobacteria bacterium]